MSISEEELFAYAIFSEWADKPGWRTYAELAKFVPNRREKYEQYLTIADKNLKLIRPPGRDIIESIGVGATLALSAQILGLTNADFRKIAETSDHRTLDYELELLSSNGQQVFNVEAKGTHDAVSLAKHRSSIRAKKDDPRRAGNQLGAVLQLGVIADLTYHRKKKPTQLYLLDPPPDKETLDPELIRLMNRLQYYLTELRWLSRGQITAALSQRVADIERLGPYWRNFDHSPLTNPYGLKVTLPALIADTVRLQKRVIAHGRLYDLRLTESLISEGYDEVRRTPTRLLFRGLHREVLEALTDQDFGRISNLKFEKESLRINQRDRYGKLELLESGLIVGILEDAWWNVKRLPDVWTALTK